MTLTVYLALVGAVVALLVDASQPPAGGAPLSDRQFWNLVVGLSEPEQPFHPAGEYQSDNLVSNERSLQDVLPNLRSRPNGAYIGVGPEQNFTYLAFLDPTIAFIVDIRRANLLEHLLYRGLFELSADRAEFAARLFGRDRLHRQSSRMTASELVTAVRGSPRSGVVADQTFRQAIGRLAQRHGFTLSAADIADLREIYRQFCDHGPDLRWSADMREWIPTYAELMVGRGGDGVQRGFLASEDAFRTVKAMEQGNRVVPIVGDFGGTHALPGIARYLAERHLIVDVFYTSNVEPYLRGDAANQFQANVAALPADSRSVIVRTTFHWIGGSASKPDYTTATSALPFAVH